MRTGVLLRRTVETASNGSCNYSVKKPIDFIIRPRIENELQLENIHNYTISSIRLLFHNQYEKNLYSRKPTRRIKRHV